MGNCIENIWRMFSTWTTHRISGKKLREIKQLAQGGYGFVSLVEDVETRKNYAMKKLICQTPEQRNMYKHQMTIMKELSHCKHIIGFYGSHEIERDGYLEAYILMELGEKTVYDALVEQQKKGKRPWSQIQILKVFREVVEGVQEMHSTGIIHRDIKVENILLSQEGIAKLCDFGSSSREKVNLKEIKKSMMYKYEEEFEKNTTLMYRPPEMIDLYLKYPVDERVDIWMLGCVLFVMNFKYHPFQEEGKLSIVNASIRYPKTCTPKMEKFMRHLLTPNPYFRPDISQILSIIDHWEEKDFKLNKVAKLISENEKLIQRGQFQQVQENEWRDLQEEVKVTSTEKFQEEWNDFE